MSDLKIYTKSGDRGQTSLVDGKRLSKSALRIDTYGTVDELNSHIGLLLSLSHQGEISAQKLLKRIQNQLFNLGSLLACEDEAFSTHLHPVNTDIISEIEAAIDQMTEELPPLTQFILPGGTPSASSAHVCRTVTRRAERLLVGLGETAKVDPSHLELLNRLSDYFFVLARYLNFKSGIQDEVWEKQ